MSNILERNFCGLTMRRRSSWPLVVVSVLSALLGAGTQRLLTAKPEPQIRIVRQNVTPVAQQVSACEAKFGAGLVASYRSSKETWCEGNARLECYHNKGLFCVAFDAVVDFSKVKGRGAYLTDSGALRMDCARTQFWDSSRFMNHMSMLKSLGGAAPHDSVEDATYLMPRDEDCENMFHSTADHLNAYLVRQITNWTQTVLWDRHPDAFIDLIRAFGPVRRPSDFGGRVLFKKLIFHLESPAGIIFPKVAGPKGIMRCRESSLWLGFVDFILKSHNLKDVAPPDVPSVMLSVRRRTEKKNVGRVFADEQGLINVLRKGNAMRYEVVDLGTLSWRDQLAKIRRTNVLIGAHGAGLMHVIFLADEAVLLEIHPSYRLDRHFRLAARMTGKIYMPMRSTGNVKCHGTSDSIPVDAAEFERAVDAALRVARSFDDGVAECGLVCDVRVLALDPSSQPYLPHNAKALSTRFPCR